MRCIWLTGQKGLTEREAALLIIEEARKLVQVSCREKQHACAECTSKPLLKIYSQSFYFSAHQGDLGMPELKWENPELAKSRNDPASREQQQSVKSAKRNSLTRRRASLGKGKSPGAPHRLQSPNTSNKISASKCILSPPPAMIQSMLERSDVKSPVTTNSVHSRSTTRASEPVQCAVGAPQNVSAKNLGVATTSCRKESQLTSCALSKRKKSVSPATRNLKSRVGLSKLRKESPKKNNSLEAKTPSNSTVGHNLELRKNNPQGRTKMDREEGKVMKTESVIQTEQLVLKTAEKGTVGKQDRNSRTAGATAEARQQAPDRKLTKTQPCADRAPGQTGSSDSLINIQSENQKPAATKIHAKVSVATMQIKRSEAAAEQSEEDVCSNSDAATTSKSLDICDELDTSLDGALDAYMQQFDTQKAVAETSSFKTSRATPKRSTVADKTSPISSDVNLFHLDVSKDGLNLAIAGDDSYVSSQQASDSCSVSKSPAQCAQLVSSFTDSPDLIASNYERVSGEVGFLNLSEDQDEGFEIVSSGALLEQGMARSDTATMPPPVTPAPCSKKRIPVSKSSSSRNATQSTGKRTESSAVNNALDMDDLFTASMASFAIAMAEREAQVTGQISSRTDNSHTAKGSCHRRKGSAADRSEDVADSQNGVETSWTNSMLVKVLESEGVSAFGTCRSTAAENRQAEQACSDHKIPRNTVETVSVMKTSEKKTKPSPGKDAKRKANQPTSAVSPKQRRVTPPKELTNNSSDVASDTSTSRTSVGDCLPPTPPTTSKTTVRKTPRRSILKRNVEPSTSSNKFTNSGKRRNLVNDGTGVPRDGRMASEIAAEGMSKETKSSETFQDIPLTYQSFSIIDVAADKKLFEHFIEDWRNQETFALSLACEKASSVSHHGESGGIGCNFSKGTGKRHVFANKIFLVESFSGRIDPPEKCGASFRALSHLSKQNLHTDLYFPGTSNVAEKSTESDGFLVEGTDLRLVGLAVSWANRDSYYVALTSANVHGDHTFCAGNKTFETWSHGGHPLE